MPTISTPSGPSPDQDRLSEPEAPSQISSNFTTPGEPAPLIPADPDAPLTFIPHTPEGAVGNQPVRIRTGRYGVLEEHELIRLLDTIEDERARSRFRESIYISVFVWIAIAGLVLFGPRYLWHAPRIRLASDVLRDRELASISLPPVPHLTPITPPKVDNNTLERLRTMTRESARPAPAPSRAPAPAAPPASLPNAPTPALTIAQPPPPQVQQAPSRMPPPVVAEAPTPQAPSRPNFNTSGSSASQSIQSAINEAARNRGAGGSGDYGNSPGRRSSPVGAGAEILSDTQGVDFGPYIRRILNDIKRNWIPLLPEETRPPLLKQGEDQIRFKIAPDGNIIAMVPEGSTGDRAINLSCWSAITSENQFPPLPKEFHGPELELRIHFLVNKGEQ